MGLPRCACNKAWRPGLGARRFSLTRFLLVEELCGRCNVPVKVDSAAVHAHRGGDTHVARREGQPFGFEWLEDDVATEFKATDVASCDVFAPATGATSEKVHNVTSGGTAQPTMSRIKRTARNSPSPPIVGSPAGVEGHQCSRARPHDHVARQVRRSGASRCSSRRVNSDSG